MQILQVPAHPVRSVSVPGYLGDNQNIVCLSHIVTVLLALP